MDQRVRQILLWTPRILGIFGIFFLGIFAFDVFGTDAGFWETMAGFLIHLIPSALILLAVALGWRWPAVGGVLFLVLAVLYTVFFGGRTGSWFALIAAPMILIGILFLSGSITQNRVQLQ